jgi:hypothetical protein
VPEELTQEELEFLRGVLDLAREGRTAELADVLERGVPVNLTGGTGDSLLILAAYHDHPETVRMLLERGVPVNLTGGTGDSLLILAAYHDHPETVRMLLERGADPDRVNDRGQTALGAAVFRQSAVAVRLLLDHGADVHAGGRSAVDVAAFFELDEMAALLAAHGAGGAAAGT